MVGDKLIVMMGVAAALIGCASYLGVNFTGDTVTDEAGNVLGASFTWSIKAEVGDGVSHYAAWVSPAHGKMRIQMTREATTYEDVINDDVDVNDDAGLDAAVEAMIGGAESSLADFGARQSTHSKGTFNMVFDMRSGTFDEHDVSVITVTKGGVELDSMEIAPRCSAGNDIPPQMFDIVSIDQDSVDAAVVTMQDGTTTEIRATAGLGLVGFRTDKVGEVTFDEVTVGIIDDDVFDHAPACRRILAETDEDTRDQMKMDDMKRVARYMAAGSERHLKIVNAQLEKMNGEPLEDEVPPVVGALRERKLLAKRAAESDGRKLGALDMPGMQYCGPDIEGWRGTNGISENAEGTGYNMPVCRTDEACNFHDNACWHKPPNDWGSKGKGASSSSHDSSRVNHNWCKGVHDGAAENCLCSNTLARMAGGFSCAANRYKNADGTDRIGWGTAWASGAAVQVAFNVLPCWSGAWYWKGLSCSGCSGCSGCGWGGCSGCSGCSGCWSNGWGKYANCFFPPVLSFSYYNDGYCAGPNGRRCGHGQSVH